MAPEPDERISVLVVDDHAVVRRGLLAFLDSEPDLEVVGDADGGTQALDLLARLDAEGRRPDVVLMDLQMEPVDGIESTRQIRDRYDDVEVVALTSFGEEERVHAALEAGASGYLLKDADADEVAAADPGRSPWRAPARSRRRPAPDVLTPRGATHDLAAELTARELEVLRLVGAGKANKEIAAELRHQRADGPDARVEHPCASSASARAPRPPSGPFAKASWTREPTASSIEPPPPRDRGGRAAVARSVSSSRPPAA